MTVTIKESLSALNLYIDNLEKMATQAQKNVERATQKAIKKSPPDLFSVPVGAPEVA